MSTRETEDVVLCVYCETTPATETDHIVPVSRGGKGMHSNQVPACRSCIMLAGDRLFSSFEEKRLYIRAMRIRKGLPMARPRINDHRDDYFADTGPIRREYDYDRKYARKTYRVPEAMHEQIKEIATDNGLGLNDLVRWIFEGFISGYESGEIILPVEEYVVTHSRLTD